MEEHIFYCYLKYQKENNPSIMKRLKRLSSDIIILLILSFLFTVLGSVFFFKKNIIVAFVFIVISGILSYVFNWRFDLYQIKHSEDIIERHRDYCSKIEDWLLSLSFASTESFEMLYDRIIDRITKVEAARKNAFEKIEKWAQVLAIPLGICIISKLIENEIDANLIISKCITVITFGALIVCFFFLLEKLKWVDIKKKTAQMQYFADDLRSILDYRLLSNQNISFEVFVVNNKEK